MSKEKLGPDMPVLLKNNAAAQSSPSTSSFPRGPGDKACRHLANRPSRLTFDSRSHLDSAFEDWKGKLDDRKRNGALEGRPEGRASLRKKSKRAGRVSVIGGHVIEDLVLVQMSSCLSFLRKGPTFPDLTCSRKGMRLDETETFCL